MNKFRCSKCRKSFKSAQGLAVHLRLSKSCSQDRETEPELPGEDEPGRETGRGKVSEKDKAINASLLERAGLSFECRRINGTWQPKPSVAGVNYREAQELCAVRQAVDNVGADRPAERDVEEEFIQALFLKWFDARLERKSPDDENIQVLLAQVSRLQAQIQELRESERKKYMDRLEASLAELAARDPLGDIALARQRLGISERTREESTVVGLVRDYTNRLDKLVERVVATGERVLLKDEFVAEVTRSPAEREQKAAELLKRIGIN
jgi:hypothetical protein